MEKSPAIGAQTIFCIVVITAATKLCSCRHFPVAFSCSPVTSVLIESPRLNSGRGTGVNKSLKQYFKW